MLGIAAISSSVNSFYFSITKSSGAVCIPIFLTFALGVYLRSNEWIKATAAIGSVGAAAATGNVETAHGCYYCWLEYLLKCGLYAFCILQNSKSLPIEFGRTVTNGSFGTSFSAFILVVDLDQNIIRIETALNAASIRCLWECYASKVYL